MTIRPFRESDRQRLNALAEASGFECNPQFPNIESFLVAEDENGSVVVALCAERIPQLYLWVDRSLHPATIHGMIRKFHAAMIPELVAKGYKGAEAFLPPSIAPKFGRRLERSFGWVKNWPSWTKVF